MPCDRILISDTQCPEQMAAEEGEQLSKLALSDGTSQGSTTFFSKRSQALTAQAASGGTRDLLFRLMSDMYDKEANPEGIVQLGIAENSQMHDYIAQFARERMVLNSVDLTYGTCTTSCRSASLFTTALTRATILATGDSFTGSKRLFKALATLYDAHLSPLKPVKEEHILTQVGLSSVIDSLAHHICDPRDGVLIPGALAVCVLPSLPCELKTYFTAVHRPVLLWLQHGPQDALRRRACRGTSRRL